MQTHKIIISRPDGRELCCMRKCTDDNGNTPLHIAARVGNNKAMKIMMEWKEEIKCDSINDKRKTPMHLAAENGHDE